MLSGQIASQRDRSKVQRKLEISRIQQRPPADFNSNVFAHVSRMLRRKQGCQTFRARGHSVRTEKTETFLEEGSFRDKTLHTKRLF